MNFANHPTLSAMTVRMMGMRAGEESSGAVDLLMKVLERLDWIVLPLQGLSMIKSCAPLPVAQLTRPVIARIQVINGCKGSGHSTRGRTMRWPCCRLGGMGLTTTLFLQDGLKRRCGHGILGAQ